MALKPLLKVKVDELFLHWLSETDTQQLLRTNLQEILKGEKVTANVNALRTPKSQSQWLRPSSPSTPPHTPNTISSPRSPRRNYHGKKSAARQLNNNKIDRGAEKELVPSKDKEAAVHKRGEPDGEPDSFLQKKQAQLREARERERGEREKQNKDSRVKPETEPRPALASGDHARIPNKKTPTTTTTANDSHQKSQNRAVSSSLSPPQKGEKIPQFYFPLGRPNNMEDFNTLGPRIKEAFSKVEGGKMLKQHIGQLAKACGFPLYWKCPLFNYAGGEKSGHITLQSFLAVCKKLCSSCHDDASRFMKIMCGHGTTTLEEEDFLPLIQDVVDTHPGLSFLQDAPEFHSRYVQTVISRIFYCVNRSWSGRISTQEIRRSNFLTTLQLLEDEEDINQITDFFSYEHFYVVYCKFWELDKDHDLYISKDDLARHNDHAISTRLIERIFSGAVTRKLVDGKMSYRDFVWFLISEEDKRHPTSIEYWFRCMDLDGDGVVSMYEMEYFYEEQVKKMEALGIETLPFEDCLCQMLDMVKPQDDGRISLRDLKACQLTPVFFDTFFNLDKYLEHEQKDPFANVRDNEEDAEMSDWERYAAEEYEILVAEEGANEGQQDDLSYEDDFEAEEEELVTLASDSLLKDPLAKSDVNPSKKDAGSKKDPVKKSAGNKASSPKDDIYDFTTDDLGY